MTSLSYQSPPNFVPNAVWAQGPLVLARDGARFPDRCIACNSDSTLKRKRAALTWAPPYVYFVLLLGLLPAVLLLLILQRKAKIDYAACSACRKRVILHRLIAFGIFLFGFVSIPLGIVTDKPAFLLLIPVCIIASLVYAIIACRVYTITRIEKGIVTLKGLSPAFVAALDHQ